MRRRLRHSQNISEYGMSRREWVGARQRLRSRGTMQLPFRTSCRMHNPTVGCTVGQGHRTWRPWLPRLIHPSGPPRKPPDGVHGHHGALVTRAHQCSPGSAAFWQCGTSAIRTRASRACSSGPALSPPPVSQSSGATVAPVRLTLLVRPWHCLANHQLSRNCPSETKIPSN